MSATASPASAPLREPSLDISDLRYCELLYQVLDINLQDPTDEDERLDVAILPRLYRELLRRIHPDKHPLHFTEVSTSAAKCAIRAFELLSHEHTREDYALYGREAVTEPIDWRCFPDAIRFVRRCASAPSDEVPMEDHASRVEPEVIIIDDSEDDSDSDGPEFGFTVDDFRPYAGHTGRFSTPPPSYDQSQRDYGYFTDSMPADGFSPSARSPSPQQSASSPASEVPMEQDDPPESSPCPTDDASSSSASATDGANDVGLPGAADSQCGPSNPSPTFEAHARRYKVLKFKAVYPHGPLPTQWLPLDAALREYELPLRAYFARLSRIKGQASLRHLVKNYPSIKSFLGY